MEDEPLLRRESLVPRRDSLIDPSVRRESLVDPSLRRDSLINDYQRAQLRAQFKSPRPSIAIAKQPFTLHLAFALAACTLGSSFQFGYNTGIVNAPIDALHKFYNQTYHERYGKYLDKSLMTILWSITVSIYCIGGLLGGVTSGYWANIYGRKTLLLCNNIILVYGLIWEVAAKYLKAYELLIVGRFILGINAGLNTGTVPLYLSEISPTRFRGLTGTFNQLCITFGVFMSEVMGLNSIFGTITKWPLAFGFPLIMCALQLLTLSFCPESPRYLFITRHQEEQAESALMWLRESNDVSEELEEMLAERENIKRMKKFSVNDLLHSKVLRLPLVICIVMHLSQQLSGINAVIYYSTDIFKNSANLKQENAQYATLATGAVNVAMTFVSALLMDKLGRRTLHLIGLGGMCSMMILLTLSVKFQGDVSWLKYIAVVAVVVYIVFFASGPGAIPWFFTAELFGQGPRGAAVGIGTAVNWFANFCVGLLFPILKQSLGSAYVFLPFVVVSATTWLFTYFKVPETRGRTLDDITESFRGDYMQIARASISAQGRL